MSLVRVNGYKVTCDEPGCNTESDINDHAFLAAQALSNWNYYGVTLNNGRNFCKKHLYGKVREGCHIIVRTLTQSDKGEWLCPKCRAKP